MRRSTLGPCLMDSRHTARYGAALTYVVVSLLALVAICSLAVDLGHVQMVKTDMTSCADATARAYINYYKLYGKTYANANGPIFYSTARNPVDTIAGVPPTVSVQWGSWNTSTRAFTAGGTTPVAIKVTLSFTRANNNALPLTWGAVIGRPTCDVTVSSIAMLAGGQSVDVDVDGTASLYLAGMPAGTVSDWGDTLSNATPFQVPTISVTPGTWITLTNVSGKTSVVPGTISKVGPGGNSAYLVHHGENYNGDPYAPGPENGIGDAVMAEDAFAGVFLGNNAPNLSSAPPAVDWTQSSMQNQATYTNIKLQQPFYIGDGSTTGGVVQQFLVPPGATRLYLGVWDGVQYSNNSGSISATVNVSSFVQIVK